MKKEIIKEAYEKKVKVTIRHKDKNRNECLIVDYNDQDVSFVWAGKRLTLPIDEISFDIDGSVEFYRDFISRKEFGMDWKHLQSLLEYRAKYKDEFEDVVTEQIARTRISKPTRIYATVEGKRVTAAMTYGTVTAVRLPNSMVLRQRYSVTSSQWENRLI